MLFPVAYDRELAARLREELADQDQVSEKAMFGGLAFLVSGHMAVCAGSDGRLMLRIDPARGEQLLADPSARPFEMRGKPMRGWLSVAVDPEEDLGPWVAEGLAYVRGLPPK